MTSGFRKELGRERRHIIPGEDTTTSMGVKAAEILIKRLWPKKISILWFCHTKSRLPTSLVF
jgi:3-oxoacyl-[acyl-carrier-protein] synthase III